MYLDILGTPVPQKTIGCAPAPGFQNSSYSCHDRSSYLFQRSFEPASIYHSRLGRSFKCTFVIVLPTQYNFYADSCVKNEIVRKM